MSRSVQDVGLSVKRLQARHHRALDGELAVLGISLVQWDALRHLAENPDASLHDLAKLTFQSDQSFGALAARMVERGLIQRLQGPGRAVRHQLTAHGQALHHAGGEIVRQVLTDSFRALTPSQLQVFDTLLLRLLDTPQA